MQSRNTRPLLLKALGGFFLILGGLAYAAYMFFFPFGMRSCRMACTLGGLQYYASNHEGAFPNVHGNPFISLARLHPPLEIELAGLSGNESAVKQQLANGGELN